MTEVDLRTVDLRRAPPPTSAAVRDRFRRQGRRDTVPELAVRRRLHARGVRYRVDVRPCRETRARGDVVWKGRKLVVFVDGCFWHACPTCSHLLALLQGPAASLRVVGGSRVLRPDAVVDRICAALAASAQAVTSRPADSQPASSVM